MVLALMLFVGCQTDSGAKLQSIPTLPPVEVAAVAVTPSPVSDALEIAETPFPTVVIPVLTPYPNDSIISIGTSMEGRDIWVWQLGEISNPNAISIVLVGGIHGGYEANTIVLTDEIIEYFREHPEDILPGIRMVIIPNANPDGLARGQNIDGRFNARGVDLNRNWGCEWDETAYHGFDEVNPGSRPFSEPESVALRMFFIEQTPDVVVFYHSAYGGIFLGECGEEPQPAWLGTLLEDATGYPYYDSFDFYDVTGDATNWLAERGIPAAVIETYSKTASEFERNLKGVIALQCHLAAASESSDQYARLCN